MFAIPPLLFSFMGHKDTKFLIRLRLESTETRSRMHEQDNRNGKHHRNITKEKTHSGSEQTEAHIGIICAKGTETYSGTVFQYFERNGKLPELFPCDNVERFKSSLETMSTCSCLYLLVDEDFSQLLEDNYKDFKHVFKDLAMTGKTLYLTDYLDEGEDFNEVKYKLPKEFRTNVIPRAKFNELTIGQVRIAGRDDTVLQVGDDNRLEVERSGDFRSTQYGANSMFQYRSEAHVTGYVLIIKTPESNHQLDVSIKKHMDDNIHHINVNLQNMNASVRSINLGSVIIEVAVDKGAKIGPVWLKKLITRILSEDIISILPKGTRMELVIRATIPLKPLDVNIFDTVHEKSHRYHLDLSPVQIQYLKNTPPAQNLILERLDNAGYFCQFDLEENGFDIFDHEAGSERLAQQIIKESVLVQEMPIGIEGFLPVPESSELEPRVVEIGSERKLVGIANNTNEGGHADSGLFMFEGDETVVSMSENCFAYLRQYKWDELTTSVGKHRGVTMSAGKGNIKLEGQRSSIEKAAKIINDEVERVNTFEINLGPDINVAVLAQVAGELGPKHRCAITYRQQFGTPPVSPESHEYQSFSLSVAGPKETKIKLVMNALENQKAHVIVNTTNRELNLKQGKGVTSSILKAAGPGIQAELRKKYPGGINLGEVAETGPGNIKTCRTIYHGALPPFPKKSSKGYKEQEDECFKWMVSLVFNCLIKASTSEKGYRTIAFPALGTGFLEYPVQHVVQLMYKAIRLYNDDARSGSIREVIIVIYPETKPAVKQLFLAHRHTHQLKSCHLTTTDQLREEKKKCEIRIVVGDALLQVVHVSTSEACDATEAVLVLWSDQEIENPKTNRSLMCTDPEKTDWKCSSYISELSESICAVDSTTLPCRTLVHVYCKDDSEKSITNAISEGLRNAAKINCNTITIPMASDGRMARKPEASAQMIINAVKGAKSDVYVVIVAIPDHTVFVPFATKVAAVFDNKLLGPADIDKSPVAVDLWEKTFGGKAAESTAALQTQMTMTSAESVLLITSDSLDKNKTVASEIQNKLASKLPVKIHSP